MRLYRNATMAYITRSRVIDWALYRGGRSGRTGSTRQTYRFSRGNWRIASSSGDGSAFCMTAIAK